MTIMDAIMVLEEGCDHTPRIHGDCANCQSQVAAMLRDVQKQLAAAVDR